MKSASGNKFDLTRLVATGSFFGVGLLIRIVDAYLCNKTAGVVRLRHFS